MIAVELGALALYVGFLIVCGFRRRIGFASWHMFAGTSICKFSLRDGDRPFNPWDHLPHTHTAMGRAELLQFLRFVEQERPRRYHGDFWLPRWFLARFVHGDPAQLARRWAPWMWLVFAIELTLPALLLVPPTRPISVVLGLGMHAAFTLMFPATLLPFSVASASTYVLFAAPLVGHRAAVARRVASTPR